MNNKEKGMTAKKYRIDVSARMVNAALVCASTEETRYYLNGVHIEPHPEGGALLVSTDGRRMVVIHDRDGICRQPGIIADSKELRRALARETGGTKRRLTISLKGELDVVGCYHATEKTLIDGTFPGWAKVLRPIFAAVRRKAIAHAVFNPQYLADFRIVADRLEKSCAIRVVSPDWSSGALVRFARIDYAFGVLMPMRVSIPEGVPTFMLPVMRKAKPAAHPARLKKPAGRK